MTFTDFALAMHPFWILGGLMAYAVSKSSYKDLLAFNAKSFGKFFLFMACVSVYRYFSIRYAMNHGINVGNLEAVKSLPIGGTLFVWWEDLAHSLPLVLLRRFIGTSKWAFPVHAIAMLLVTLSFASGHLYQGVLPALLLSLYIPFGVNFGQKKGFGTLTACHVLYDLSTLLTLRLVLCS